MSGPAGPRPVPSFARFQEPRRKDYEARIALEKKKEEEEEKEEEAKKRQEEEDKRKKEERNRRFAPTSVASGSQEEPMEFNNTRLVVAGQDGKISADIRNEHYRPKRKRRGKRALFPFSKNQTETVQRPDFRGKT